MDRNIERYQKIKDLVGEIQHMIELEKEYCNTHSQRNAAMHLIRVLVEDLRSEIISLDVKPSGEDANATPF